MHHRPHAHELLGIARETLLKELLPQLPKEYQLAALMVANAMAIAGREIGAGQADAQQELDRFARLYGEDQVTAAGVDPPSRLAALNTRLARDLRADAFQEAQLQQVRELLLEQVQARLRVSNPKYLKAAGS